MGKSLLHYRYVIRVSNGILTNWGVCRVCIFHLIAKNKAEGVWHGEARNAYLVQSEVAALGHYLRILEDFEDRQKP